MDLTPAERERGVARFERPLDIDRESRPLTSKERATFEKSRGMSGGSFFTFKVDVNLLGEAARAARKQGISLEQFMAQAIRGMLTGADQVPVGRKRRKSA